MKIYYFLRLYTRRFFRRLKYLFIWKELKEREQKQSCMRCGKFMWIDYNLKDEKWLEIMGHEGGCLCMDCMLEVCNNRDIKLDIDDFELIFIMTENHGSFNIRNKNESINKI